MPNVVFPDLPTYTGTLSLAGILSLLITVALPVIAGLFMQTHWSAFAKGLVLLAFSAVKAILEAWLIAANAHVTFYVGQVLYTVAVQFAMAVVAYYGLGIRGSRLQRAAINGGVIRSSTPTRPPR